MMVETRRDIVKKLEMGKRMGMRVGVGVGTEIEDEIVIKLWMLRHIQAWVGIESGSQNWKQVCTEDLV